MKIEINVRKWATIIGMTFTGLVFAVFLAIAVSILMDAIAYNKTTHSFKNIRRVADSLYMLETEKEYVLYSTSYCNERITVEEYVDIRPNHYLIFNKKDTCNMRNTNRFLK